MDKTKISRFIFFWLLAVTTLTGQELQRHKNNPIKECRTRLLTDASMIDYIVSDNRIPAKARTAYKAVSARLKDLSLSDNAVAVCELGALKDTEVVIAKDYYIVAVAATDTK